MLTAVWSGRFKRDVKRAEKGGKDISKLKDVLSLLIEQQPLPAAFTDHPLKGDWKGFRDLHISLIGYCYTASSVTSYNWPELGRTPTCSPSSSA